MWSMLGQTIGYTLFWYIYIFPIIFKIIAWIIKLSVLNISTWFRGWVTVREELTEVGVKKGIALGKYPSEPPQAVWTNERLKARLTLFGGAVVNLYVVCIVYLLASGTFAW